MLINFRTYEGAKGISDDYHLVRDFLIDIGYKEFTYVRLDWMISHSMLDESYLDKIGLWEHEGELVGLATYDVFPGQAFCLTRPEYEFLKKDMLLYSMENLNKEDKFTVAIADTDEYFKKIAAELGFVATRDSESDAIFYLNQTSTEYELPEGFEITSMDKDYDLRKYRDVLWRGFNHVANGEGELVYNEEVEKSAKQEMERDNVDLDLKIAVKNDKGDFVSYCGIWYDNDAGYGVIEPVATDPKFRKLGLAKAAVLEGIKRVGEKGGKYVLVGSSQQFYYNIGMRPYRTATLWSKLNK